MEMVSTLAIQACSSIAAILNVLLVNNLLSFDVFTSLKLLLCLAITACSATEAIVRSIVSQQ